MTLFSRIQDDPRFSDRTSFVYLFLCRLSISELMAVSKFKKTTSRDNTGEPVVIKNVRERCLSRGYGAETTNSMLSVFQEIFNLAQLIQTTWLNESQHKTEATIKQEALSLAQAITSKTVTQQTIFDVAREHAATLTDQLIESLTQLQAVDTLQDIVALLQETFPSIDVDRVASAIQTIKTNIDTLNNHHDTVLIGADHRLFTAVTETTPSDHARSQFRCTIS